MGNDFAGAKFTHRALQDQLFFMKRCGIDAYALREDKDIAAALASLRDFSEAYQAAVDQPQPLFRRRTA